MTLERVLSSTEYLMTSPEMFLLATIYFMKVMSSSVPAELSMSPCSSEVSTVVLIIYSALALRFADVSVSQTFKLGAALLLAFMVLNSKPPVDNSITEESIRKTDESRVMDRVTRKKNNAMYY